MCFSASRSKIAVDVFYPAFGWLLGPIIATAAMIYTRMLVSRTGRLGAVLPGSIHFQLAVRLGLPPKGPFAA
jgi:hypothetical protein